MGPVPASFWMLARNQGLVVAKKKGAPTSRMSVPGSPMCVMLVKKLGGTKGIWGEGGRAEGRGGAGGKPMCVMLLKRLGEWHLEGGRGVGGWGWRGRG